MDTGWPDNAYAVSKIGVTAMSMVHQKMFDGDGRAGIIVNSVSPRFNSSLNLLSVLSSVIIEFSFVVMRSDQTLIDLMY